MWRALAIVAGALALTGCATSTRTMQMGVLPQGHQLVTLVVSEDREVVHRECASVTAGWALGCHRWRRVALPGAGDVTLITIVRYTDALPSTLALEIDVHELCHAIAALQPIADPCHADNGGIIRSAADPAFRRR